jgi:glycosyltransferase involved in cell wall biosynthesis
MKIGFDATVLTRRSRTGVDRYAEEIIRHLIPLAPDDRFVLSYFVGDRDPERRRDPVRTIADHHPNVVVRPIRFPPLRWYRALSARGVRLPFDLAARGRADVYVFPDFVSWPIFSGRSIVVVHDLAFANRPEYVPPRLGRYLERAVPRSIAEAVGVAAVSEFTKRELVSAYGIDPDHVTVIPNGVDREHFFPRGRPEVEAVTSRLGIHQPYVLMTGTIEPRKNVVGLLEAFGALPAGLRDSHALVLAGGKGWLDEEIHRRAAALRSSGAELVQPGYVDSTDLPALYSGAAAFVLPSHYEGFGIPVLEAMACGAPVITSRNGALPEVAGDAAILVGTRDHGELAAAIERVLSDPRLGSDLRARGLERATRFSWEASARALLELIRRSVAGSRSTGGNDPRGVVSS